MYNEYGLPLSDDKRTMIYEACGTTGGLLTVDPTRLLSVMDRYNDLRKDQGLLLDLECDLFNNPELIQKVDSLRKKVYHPHNIAFLHRWDGIAYQYDKIVNEECKGNIQQGMSRVCAYYKKVIVNEN